MRFLPFLLLRLASAFYFLATSAYAALNCSPFAFDMFVRPQLFPGLAKFVAWHHVWYWAAYAATVVPLVPILRRAPDGRRFQAARGLAAGYVVVFYLIGLALLASPFLPTLWNDSRALPAALVALVPLVVLAAVDLLRAPARQLSGEPFAPPSQGRLLAAAGATAGFLWALHLARSVASTGGGWDPAGWTVAGLRALSAFAVLGAAAYTAAMLLAGLAARTRVPGAVELAGAAAGLGAVLCEFLRRSVLPTVAIDGAVAALLSVAFASTLAVTWAALAVVRPVGGELRNWTAFDQLLGVRGPRLAVLAGLPLVGAASWLSLDEIERIDWSYVGQRTVLLLESMLVLGLMLRATASPPVAAWSLRVAVLPPVMAVAFFAALPAGVSAAAKLSGDPRLEPAVAFQHHALTESAYRSVNDLLVERGGGNAEYYQFLLDHADFSRGTRITVPDVDLAAPAAPASLVGRERPDIFLFVIDSLRPDYLSPYNPAVSFTPNIAAFAADSFTFRNAFTRHGGTELAMTSIWAGAAVVRKVRSEGLARMNAVEKLVNAEGYRVVINDFTVADHLLPTTPVTRIDEGVQSVDTDLCSNLTSLQTHLDATATDARPVLGYFAPMNVHILNTVRRKAAGDGRQYPGFLASYASRVERMDGCFGQFVSYLKARGRYDNSIIVLTSDHGDSLGENGVWGHAVYLFPEDVRIPLIVHIPEGSRGQVTTDLARLAFSTDIAPTLYELLGKRVADLPPPFGESLFVPRGGALSDRRRGSYLLTSSYGPTYALLRRNGRSVYVSELLEWRESAYDLSKSPLGTPVPIDAATREVNQAEIRRHVADLSAFYGFTR